MHQVCVDSIETAKGCVISAEHNFVGSGKLNTDAIVGEGSVRVEVENENVTVTVEADDFVAFMSPSDVAWIAVQPTVLFLR